MSSQPRVAQQIGERTDRLRRKIGAAPSLGERGVAIGAGARTVCEGDSRQRRRRVAFELRGRRREVSAHRCRPASRSSNLSTAQSWRSRRHRSRSEAPDARFASACGVNAGSTAREWSGGQQRYSSVASREYCRRRFDEHCRRLDLTTDQRRRHHAGERTLGARRRHNGLVLTLVGEVCEQSRDLCRQRPLGPACRGAERCDGAVRRA